MVYAICLLISWSADETPVSLGVGQSWYEQAAGTAQEIEGILDYRSGSGRIGISANFRAFRLIRQDKDSKIISTPLHAPGHETVLALNVGQRVRLQAKTAHVGEGEGKREELWIGKLTALGLAPANAYTEIKPLARTNQFFPNTSRVQNELSTSVMKSGADVAKTLGITGPGSDREATAMLANMLGVKSIDWKKEMVVYLGMIYTRNQFNTNKLEVSRLEVHDKGVTVHWRVDQTRLRNNPQVLTETILIPKIEGEVTFKKEEKKEEAAPEKIAPVPVPEKKR